MKQTINKEVLDKIAPVRLGDDELAELSTLERYGYKVSSEPDYLRAVINLKNADEN